MRARLRELADDALKTIRETMSGTDIPPGSRLKAALSVLQSVGAMGESTGDAAEKWRNDDSPVSGF